MMRMLWAWVFSVLGDYLLRTGKVSRTNVRKLATFCCDVIQARGYRQSSVYPANFVRTYTPLSMDHSTLVVVGV